MVDTYDIKLSQMGWGKVPKTIVNRVIHSARRILLDDDSAGDTVDQFDMVQTIEEARLDWLRAKSYFENVLDPDLVDYAIYSMEATERKYMYLLKQAKSLGVALDGPFAVGDYQVIYD